MWFHNVTSLQFGVAINIFWRHLEKDAYDKSDPYGNKDPVVANKAIVLLNKAMKELDSLPDEYKQFYYRQMVSKVKEHITD